MLLLTGPLLQTPVLETLGPVMASVDSDQVEWDEPGDTESELEMLEILEILETPLVVLTGYFSDV